MNHFIHFLLVVMPSALACLQKLLQVFHIQVAASEIWLDTWHLCLILTPVRLLKPFLNPVAGQMEV